MRLNKSIISSFISILVGIAFFTAPAFSAPKDVKLLNSYIGNWRGSGELKRDGNIETVRCKLAITKAKAGKINYKGRCAVAGANFSIAGTMAYIKKAQRFEAVMSTSTSFSGVAIGKYSNKNDKEGIDFQLSDRNAETGDKFKISSNIALKEEMIGIDFIVTNKTTGRIVSADIPFEMK